mmetsp:Transcript_23366/g.32658  ORF Transcript_23366/g.32658 Transcript_23366/m.32658 type:complete len:119 (+) Transcript_23366:111-467(+)
MSLDDCIKHCSECAQLCQRAKTHCIIDGKHVTIEHLNLLEDCVEICQTSANFMLRGSKNHNLIYQICAQICEACALECEKTCAENDLMKQCASKCRECAQMCRPTENQKHGTSACKNH